MHNIHKIEINGRISHKRKMTLNAPFSHFKCGYFRSSSVPHYDTNAQTAHITYTCVWIAHVLMQI